MVLVVFMEDLMRHGLPWPLLFIGLKVHLVAIVLQLIHRLILTFNYDIICILSAGWVVFTKRWLSKGWMEPIRMEPILMEPIEVPRVLFEVTQLVLSAIVPLVKHRI